MRSEFYVIFLIRLCCIFNIQSSIPSCPGWVLSDIKTSRKDFLSEVMNPVIGFCLNLI